MKIEIMVEGTNQEVFTLDNDTLENDNYVTLYVDKNDYDISIDDLYSAVGAFIEQRRLRIEREKSYE